MIYKSKQDLGTKSVERERPKNISIMVTPREVCNLEDNMNKSTIHNPQNEYLDVWMNDRDTTIKNKM